MHSSRGRSVAGAWLAGLTIVIGLVGCVGAADSETRLRAEQNGVEVTVTLLGEGDRIVQQTTESVLTYEALGVTDAEGARAVIDPAASELAEANDLPGVEYSLEYGAAATIERVVVDYTVVDPAALAEATGSDPDNAEGAPRLSAQIAELEASGFAIIGE